VRKLAGDGFASKRSITPTILGLFQKAYNPACHAYSGIVDSFVIDSFFFLRNIFHTPQYYRWLRCYVYARLCQCFGQGGCYFRCDKPCTCSSTRTQHFFYSAVAHILTPSVNLAFETQSGFKNKCRARAEFGLVISGSGRVQALNWGPFTTLSMYAGANKGRLKGYILHPPTVNIEWNHFVKSATLVLVQMLLLLVRGYQWSFW